MVLPVDEDLEPCADQEPVGVVESVDLLARSRAVEAELGERRIHG